MQVHEVCEIFPMMSPDEFAGLKADIAANGQREPVWTYQGKVIDGRNRLKACDELGITPKVREWDAKGSLTEFVVSLNLHRRHLTSGQRAACGTEIEERLAVEAEDRKRELCRREALKREASRREEVQAKKPTPLLPKEEKRQEQVVAKLPQPAQVNSQPKSREQAAKIVGSSPRYLQDAKTVKASSPDLHQKVKNGEITLPQAKREVARAEKRSDLEAKAAAVVARPMTEAPTWEITQGDCVEILSTLDRECYRLIFADPPYNIGIDYGDHHDDEMESDDFIKWCESWMRPCVDLLTPDGSMWVLINDEWADVFGCLLRDVGLHRRSWIKWYETFGVNNSNNFNRCSRHLFYMTKSKDRFVFNADAVNRPSARQMMGDKRADPGGKIWDNIWGINPAIPRLVENAKERLPDFPTQLPLALLLAIVGCASDPGDLVLDPFNGSGTTGEAAIQLGRRYRGVEKSETFALLARLRLTAARKDDGNPSL